MGIKIDIAPKDLKALKDLLKQYLPNTLVWAFGSRVKFTAKPTSDLDLVAFISKEQELKFSLLKDAFEESNIPFRIDLHNWHELPKTFHKNIESSFVVLQEDKKEEMPSKWKTYKLSELVEIKYGKDHKHLADGEIPLYGSGGIMRYVDTPLYEQESILIPRKGTLSNLFYLNIPFWSVDTMFYTKIKAGNNGKYLYYLLKSMDLASMNVGSAVPSLTTEVLNKVEINVPDEATQIEISQILTSLDDKIELNLQMNQTLEAMAQAIFKEWFVDFKFPGFDGVLVDGLPKGWKVIELSKLISVKDGTHDSPKQTENGKFLITSKHLKNHFINFESAYRISEEDFEKINKRSKVDKLDVLITMIGTVGNLYFVHDEVMDFAIKNIGLFKTSENPDLAYFLYFTISSKEISDYFIKRLAGSTQQYLTLDTLRQTPIVFPDDETLKLFNDFAKSIYHKIEVNSQNIQSLTQTRDTLLPKLMSGKISLNQDLQD